MGCDTARGLAAGLHRETGATRRRESHDTTLEARDTAPCETIRRSAPCDTTQGCCDTRCSARHALQRATRRARMTLVLGVSRYKLRHSRLGLRHDRPCLRHDRPQATIRLGTGPQHSCDKAVLSAVRAACACRLGQGVCTVHQSQF